MDKKTIKGRAQVKVVFRQLSVVRSHRPRSSPAIRSLSLKEKEVMDDPQPSTSRGLSHLSNTPDPLLNLIIHSSDEECVESDEKYMLPTKRCRAEDHYGEFFPFI